ncbi:MAG TPA: SCE4755 family polysaccharide monooxygenase-like protein [Polyangiaceae bacterium]|jgi:hypothetical protein
MRRALVFGFALAAVFVVARSSDAHFELVAPASWMSQDPVGSPQKLGPCGDELDGTDAATPSGIVTAYKVGDTITITIDEKVFHPGHYRVALGMNGPGDLPAEPAVDAGASFPCGSAVIENPPVFPVIADDVFDHTQPFTSPQTTTVTLPPNVSCDHCTLQVIEFMSDHGLNNPGGCFYHHCADISVGSDGGTPPPPQDASAPKDASPIGAEPESPATGCSCNLAPRTTGSGLYALLLVTGLFCGFRASRRRKSR